MTNQLEPSPETAVDKDLDAVCRAARDLQVRLSEEGWQFGPAIISALLGHIDDLGERLTDALAGAKSSRGRERASASGTISKPAQHRHEYGSDGICIKVTAGGKCTAKQRGPRKARQTATPNGTELGLGTEA